MSDDFDWIKARLACSPQMIFKELEYGVGRDVDTIKAQRPERAEEFQVLPAADGKMQFSIIRHHPKGRSETVEFSLVGEKIAVKNPLTGAVSFTASLTLNNDGECRLKVNNEELEQWQVRRKALEDLLFSE
jgi:hypothetical protein